MRLILAGVFAIAMALPAGAQTPKPPAATPPVAEKPPAPKAAAPKAPARGASTPDTFTYDSGGRRDPFLSLVGTGTEPRTAGIRADGVAGLTVAEISVRGHAEPRPSHRHMQPDNKTHIHQGDKFVDGTVKSITPQGLVLVRRQPPAVAGQTANSASRCAEGGKQ